jgi:hypothetical protein
MQIKQENFMVKRAELEKELIAIKKKTEFMLMDENGEGEYIAGIRTSHRGKVYMQIDCSFDYRTVGQLPNLIKYLQEVVDSKILEGGE